MYRPQAEAERMVRYRTETDVAVASFSAMPIFYLHLRNSVGLIHDQEGAEYADLDAARTEAIASARDIMAAQIRTGEAINLADRIEIDDERGEVAALVFFNDVVTIAA